MIKVRDGILESTVTTINVVAHLNKRIAKVFDMKYLRGALGVNTDAVIGV